MGYTAYPEYRDSGVAWLEGIPIHWNLKKIRYIAHFTTGWTPPTGNSSSYEGDNWWATIGDLGCRYIEETQSQISNQAAENAGISLAPTGSLLFSFKLSVGLVSIAKLPLFTNEAIATFRPGQGFDIGWAYYAFPIFIPKNSATNIYGAQLLNQQRINDAQLALPPLPEQQTIARFLDHKTAQIDALIAKKEALLQKLAEKRTALISQAVTQGLDPTVPMKDSGVAWLGKIPAHWGMTRLKYATALIVDCPHDTPQYSPEGDFLVIRTADLSSGVMDLSSAYRVDEDEYIKRIRRAEVKPGDILYGREGERWGFAAEVPEEPKVCLGQRMMQFRASAHFCPHYLMWHLNADCVYQQGVVDTYGSTAPHVNVETIQNYWLVEPPLAEQETIAKHLDAVTTKFAKQVAAARRAISTLSEYRSALITAAVTGKIDVRGVPLPAEVSP